MRVRKQALFSIETGSPFSSEVAKGPRSQTFTAGCEREVGGEMRPLFFFWPPGELAKRAPCTQGCLFTYFGPQTFPCKGLALLPEVAMGARGLDVGAV